MSAWVEAKFGVTGWADCIRDDRLLKYIVDSGISSIELMAPAAEIYAGSPATKAAAVPQSIVDAERENAKARAAESRAA